MTSDVQGEGDVADPSALAVDIGPLMTMSRTINAVIVRSLAAVDATVSVPQLRVLVILSVEDRLNLSSVAERLGVNPSNASRTCQQLVEHGLVDRQADTRDRRQLALVLTRAGRRLLEDVMTRRELVFTDVVAALPAADQRALMTALEKFNAVAETRLTDLAPHEGAHLMTRWLSN